jgi:hypothetical protein
MQGGGGCVSAHRPVIALGLTMRLKVHGSVSMSSPLESEQESVRHERAVSSLSDRSGAPRAQVRSLFAQEFSRLELGAKVRAYLGVLTASNVHRMLRRKARGAMEDSRVRPGGANEAKEPPARQERPAP